MRRSLALGALGALAILPLGCGYGSYEARLGATEGRIRDEMILNTVLAGPLQDAFARQNIYLRVPQGLAQAEQFQPIPLNPGVFDVEASFIPPGSEDQLAGGPFQLHVLARRESEEEPEAGEQPEGGDQPEQPPAQRNDFRTDVLAVLGAVYTPEAASAPVEQVSKTIWPRGAEGRSNSFERMTLTDRNQQLIHVYFYHEQSGNATYDVALIWEFPGGQAPAAGSNPVDLTLGTFAVGQRASARFSGRPDGPGGAPGEGGGSAVAF